MPREIKTTIVGDALVSEIEADRLSAVERRHDGHARAEMAQYVSEQLRVHRLHAHER